MSGRPPDLAGSVGGGGSGFAARHLERQEVLAAAGE